MLCFYMCLFCLIVVSNDAILGVIGEDPDIIALKIEDVDETPQQLAEWTPDDIF